MLNQKSKEVFSLHYASFRFDNLLTSQTRTSIHKNKLAAVEVSMEETQGIDEKEVLIYSWASVFEFIVLKLGVLLTSLFMFFTATSLVITISSIMQLSLLKR